MRRSDRHICLKIADGCPQIACGDMRSSKTAVTISLMWSQTVYADTLEDVLRRQAGVVRTQDVASWLTDADIRREVADGRWRMPHRGIYVAHNAELTAEQERWVCLLAGPPGSALCGLTAAALDGFEGAAASDNHLVIPAGARRPKRSGLAVHFSTQLGVADVHPVREPRRTRPARSLVDAATFCIQKGASRAIILAGVQQRLVRPEDLRDALSRRGPCRHHAVIIESIADAEGGIASIPEHDFDLILRRFHLPEPDRQAVVRRPGGRYYLDADWLRFRVACEVHGTQHLAIPAWDADLDRHNELTADGRRILQFSSYTVRHRKEHVGAVVTRALRQAGWR